MRAMPARKAVSKVAAGYSGTPLPKKLGLRAGGVLALAGAPAKFADTLGPLPEGARLRTSARGACDVALWFVESTAAYAKGLHAWARRDDWRALWVAWPKKASGYPTDLTEDVVRRFALAAGLVDYKVCAIDAKWSGLCFARRKQSPE